MASTIKLKRSSVAGKSPNTSILSTGELALNLADKRLYSSNGTAILEIGTNPSTLSINGAYSFPVSDGTNGQALVTDGAGNITFGTVATEGGGGQSANVSLFANGDTSTVTSSLSGLDLNDKVVANPDGFIKLLTGNAQELRVPYFGAPGVNLDNGIISVTGGVSVSATFTNYFGQINADGTNLVASSPNNQVSFIGSGGISVSGSSGNNTVTIGASIPSSLTDLSISDGSSGQFLKTDGAGNFTFDTPESGASVTVSDSAPVSPSAGDLWFDSSDLNMYIYYNDGSSQQWIDISGSIDVSNFATSSELDQYLQVANTSSFATVSQLDNYLQVANTSSSFASTGKAIAMAIVFGG